MVDNIFLFISSEGIFIIYSVAKHTLWTSDDTFINFPRVFNLRSNEVSWFCYSTKHEYHTSHTYLVPSNFLIDKTTNVFYSIYYVVIQTRHFDNYKLLNILFTSSLCNVLLSKIALASFHLSAANSNK